MSGDFDGDPPGVGEVGGSGIGGGAEEVDGKSGGVLSTVMPVVRSTGWLTLANRAAGGEPSPRQVAS